MKFFADNSDYFKHLAEVYQVPHPAVQIAKEAATITALRCVEIAEAAQVRFVETWNRGESGEFDIGNEIRREFGLSAPESDGTASTTHENPGIRTT